MADPTANATSATDREALREAARVLPSCVDCGACLSACPTYALLGDERDGPRGRLTLFEEVLGLPAAPAVHLVHVDRCIGCSACEPVCPEKVDFRHVLEPARARAARASGSAFQRWLRGWLSRTLPDGARLRRLVAWARWARPLRFLFPRSLRHLLELVPPRGRLGQPLERDLRMPSVGPPRATVGVFTGCLQHVLGPQVHEATWRLLIRHGCEVIILKDALCCGAIDQSIGDADTGRARAEANLRAWRDDLPFLDAIVTNTAGCGAALKDYGHLLAESPLADDAKRLASLARDITEVLDDFRLSPTSIVRTKVAYRSACALENRQGIVRQATKLLEDVGFEVLPVEDGEACCGAGGVWGILQPDLSARLRARDLERLQAARPDVIAVGDIGCIAQLQVGAQIPVVHTLELVDWATGGPKPAAMR